MKKEITYDKLFEIMRILRKEDIDINIKEMMKYVLNKPKEKISSLEDIERKKHQTVNCCKIVIDIIENKIKYLEQSRETLKSIKEDYNGSK